MAHLALAAATSNPDVLSWGFWQVSTVSALVVAVGAIVGFIIREARNHFIGAIIGAVVAGFFYHLMQSCGH